MTLFEVTWQGQRSLEVKIVIIILVNLFQILFKQVRFNYNQTWIICRYNKGAQWEPSRYDAFLGHMTRSKVIGGQIVTVIWRQIVIVMVALFQIAPAWTGSLRLQPNLNHRCTMGTFTLWRTARSHDKVKCHFRSTSLKLVLIFCLRSFLLWYCYICNFLTSRVTHVFFT